MWRWMRWVLAILVVFGLYIAADTVRTNRKMRIAQREQNARYGAMLETIRKDYPIGMALADAISLSKQQHISFSWSGKELLLPLGSDPSFVWYCDNWITYAGLTFDGDVFDASPALRLQKISKMVIGGNCL